MALQIISNEISKIYIDGTDIEIPSVYLRLSWFARENGDDIEVSFYTYINENKYNEGKPILTNLGYFNLHFVLENNEKQDYDVIHNYCQQYFTQLGYDVEIL